MEENNPHLIRGIGLGGAVSANILNMVGIGPFLTIPIALAAMGGPQAILGWILGAFISVCDGMVWAELGSAMPVSGGPYYYLLEIFGPRSFGRLISFIFLGQALIIGPLSAASGAVGFAEYSRYLVPWLSHSDMIGLAVLVVLANTGLVYRNIRSIGLISMLITVVVIGTSLWIIFAGVTHFHAATAFSFPAGAFRLSRGFFVGLGAATLIALYDYGGYYNVCLFGEEVRDPTKTIPRAILLSIACVAFLYLAMNISILGVLPWQRGIQSHAIVADFMELIYGPLGGKAVSWLILVASFASVFAILLGYSRIPYAAAVDGRFFAPFAKLHSTGKFPYVSVLAMGLLSALACVFSLAALITVLIIVQTMVQFIGQCIAVMVLRQRAGKKFQSYKMPLYPVPALIALAGWVYIVVTSEWKYIGLSLILITFGIAVYMVRAYRAAEWPFGAA
ncbi:MAG TPA: amino acid permease [Acidobacteriaceae bacterium]|nr:amino acid permease [Acidobacteriaceae bacterium]